MSESGLTPQEEGALRRVRLLADLMDDAVTVPGTDRRIGLDALVGLAPVSGDLVTAVISMYTVGEAVRVGAEPNVIGKMLLNILLDFGIGSIPVLGDIFDAIFKSNVRNAELLEEHLTSR
ncbi:DUF4112 domain-containing protein [Halogeometricum pallidum]|nr:DUF4112 domain-containing protein [Halogeometricum pallidum]